MESRADWQYTRECLETECWLTGTGGDQDYGEEYSEVSSSPPTPDWMKPDDSNSYFDSDESDYEEQMQAARAAHAARSVGLHFAAIPAAPPTPTNVYNPNDPLRYFLVNRDITPGEYDKWKIVIQYPPARHDSTTESRSSSKPRTRVDYGPGYNSTSDSESDICVTPTTPTTPITAPIPAEIGHGYLTFAEQPDGLFDPWTPNSDPTDTCQYAKHASSAMFRMSRFAEPIQENIATTSTPTSYKLCNSFALKLLWERYETRSSKFYTLQTFWQNNSLQIYEALQDLVDASASSSQEHSPPLYHTTPVEMLENTFETIGRMCRCIADDFNTPSIVAYVKEFIVSLYQEIEFVHGGLCPP